MATVKKVKKAQGGIKATSDSTKFYKDQEKSYRTLSKSEKGDTEVSKFNKDFFDRAAGKAVSDQLRQYHKGSSGYDANGFPIKKKKSGGKVMMKRADGSVSQRGLWDNLRAAKGSGKKPTAQMLKQEKKIKSQTKKK